MSGRTSRPFGRCGEADTSAAGRSNRARIGPTRVPPTTPNRALACSAGHYRTGAPYQRVSSVPQSHARPPVPFDAVSKPEDVLSAPQVHAPGQSPPMQAHLAERQADDVRVTPVNLGDQ